MDYYMRYVQRRASSRQDQVRRLQEESSRTEEQVIRMVIYNDDVRFNVELQHSYVYVFRVHEGALEFLPPGTAPEATVKTDFPTMWGIANGEFVQVFDDGRRKLHKDFTVFDAYRLGRLKCEGSTSVLTNLYLFEKRISPEILKEMRLPSPEKLAATT